MKFTEIKFENSYCGTFTAFSGRYYGKFFVGNNDNDNSKFKVGNYKDFKYDVNTIEKHINDIYKGADNMKQLPLETWKNIFRNVAEINEDLKAEGFDEEPIEVMYLDGGSNWGIMSGDELFEEGFATEQEAQDRLTYLENTILGGVQ